MKYRLIGYKITVLALLLIVFFARPAIAASPSLFDEIIKEHTKGTEEKGSPLPDDPARDSAQENPGVINSIDNAAKDNESAELNNNPILDVPKEDNAPSSTEVPKGQISSETQPLPLPASEVINEPVNSPLPSEAKQPPAAIELKKPQTPAFSNANLKDEQVSHPLPRPGEKLFGFRRLLISRDIRNREPVGQSTVFLETVDEVYCFLEASNIRVRTTAIFRWFYEGRQVSEFKTGIGPAASWRTWSKKSIEGARGSWEVRVYDLGLNLIGSVNFTVGAEKESIPSEGGQSQSSSDTQGSPLGPG